MVDCGVDIDLKKEVIEPLLIADNLVSVDSYWYTDNNQSKQNNVPIEKKNKSGEIVNVQCNRTPYR